MVGKDVPLPGDGTTTSPAVIGARRIEVLNRAAALIRVRVGDDDVTYLVQHARGIVPERSERQDGPLHAMAWRKGAFTIVAVGAEATAASWRAAFRTR